MNRDKLEELYDIAKSEDIGVFFRNMSDGLNGYATLSDDCYDLFLNIELDDDEILKSMAHEMGHINGNMCFEWKSDYLNNLYERRAENFAVSYIVPYEDVVGVLNDKYIRCEYEAAEELRVDVNTFAQAIEYYKTKGFPVRQCEIMVDWRQWDY